MFCFLCYVALRDLPVLSHSFPTRRSSDLQFCFKSGSRRRRDPGQKDKMVSETTECKSVGANEESAEAFGSRVRSAVIWRSGSQILAQIITWASTLLVIRLLEDRKSTRLNSSH